MKTTQVVVSRPGMGESLGGPFQWSVAVVEFSGRRRAKVLRARGGYAATEARANSRVDATLTAFLADLPEGAEVVDGG